MKCSRFEFYSFINSRLKGYFLIVFLVSNRKLKIKLIKFIMFINLFIASYYTSL